MERGDSEISGKAQFPLLSEVSIYEGPLPDGMSVSDDERRVEDDFTESNENSRRGGFLSFMSIIGSLEILKSFTRVQAV